MEKDIRERVAFALNFVLPGLGICFSGLVHRLRWLLGLGLGIGTVYLLLGPRVLASYNLYMLLTSYSFDISDTLLTLAMGFIIAFLGAVVESEISEKWIEK